MEMAYEDVELRRYRKVQDLAVGDVVDSYRGRRGVVVGLPVIDEHEQVIVPIRYTGRRSGANADGVLCHRQGALLEVHE